MKRIVPSYYPQFQCIASACRHNCCREGWEIDVDEDSAAYFRALPGALGESIRSGIAWEGDCPHIQLNEQGQCPFLTEEGLCGMYQTLGEDSLCQICADHPRFRNFFADRTEEGLGLCCEEVGRLVLTSEEPAVLVTLPEDGEELEPDEDYLQLLEYRDQIFAMLCDGNQPLLQRLATALDWSGEQPAETDLVKTLDFLLSLEILRPEWRQALEQLKERPRTGWDEEMDADGERLACYLVFRYYLSWGLERWYETFPLQFAVFSLRLLAALRQLTLERKGTLTMEDRIEWLRLWSEELEYSEENLEAIAEYLA